MALDWKKDKSMFFRYVLQINNLFYISFLLISPLKFSREDTFLIFPGIQFPIWGSLHVVVSVPISNIFVKWLENSKVMDTIS